MCTGGNKLENFITPDFSQVSAPLKAEKPKVMLSVERNGEQTHVRINASSLSVIQTCPRKSYYLLHEKWKSMTTSKALVYGTAIHKALEVFYSHSKRDRSIPIDFEEVAPTLAQCSDAPKALESHFLYDSILAFVAAAEPLRSLPDTDECSIVSGIWVLMHYFKVYLHDPYVVHSDDQGPMVERSFSIPYYEDSKLRITLFGTIDLILKNEATQEIIPSDHKTASRMGNDFLNRIKPNHQYTAYLIGANTAFGLSGENFMVNGIQKKARPLTSRGGPPTFTRQITRRSEEDFQEFKEALRWSVHSYLTWMESGVWPIGVVDACASYGSCQYLEVCGAPNELRQNILDAKFRRESDANVS